ncbi:MAG: SDR family oxidoreductase [Candidatus Hydrogenedentes bacterium]|nr:SDR family oxidoreductase [Candidatus Hydrogenedentota bacterium]
MKLIGKTVLITGSCSEGMGRSTALRLGREGANIILNYGTHRTGVEVQEEAGRVAAAIRELGGQAIVVEANTTSEQDVVALVRAAQNSFGPIDILVNNAGGDWTVRDLTEIDFDHWRKVLAAEVDATFLLLRSVLPDMRQRRWGRIIHISMDGALRLQTMAQRAPDYCLGKAVRSWMATAWGLQEFDSGITVNCVEPGLTEHMTFEAALEAARGDDAAWRQRANVTCHDIAEAVAYLCSEEARFVSGSIIRIPTDQKVLPR